MALGSPFELRTKTDPHSSHPCGNAFRFDVTSKCGQAVEVDSRKSAHECLERLIHLAEIDSLFENLVSIDIHENLRHRGQKRRNQARELGAFAGGFQKFFQVLCEKGDVFARAIFQYELETAGSADARNRRRRKREGETFGDTGELFVNVRLDGGVLFFRLGPFAPGLNVTREPL